jgi:hypothetical protein
MKRLLLLCASLLLAPGCYRVAINTPAPASGQNGTDSGASFVGLTTVTTEARECTYGVARAETVMPVWGLLLQLFTAGIVTGMTAEYHCAAGPGQRGVDAGTQAPRPTTPDTSSSQSI